MDGFMDIQEAVLRVPSTTGPADAQSIVLIITDDPSFAQSMESICEFLDIGVEALSSDHEVGHLLSDLRPMAVIATADGGGQDGFNVMMQVAEHDRDLPVMLLTGHDPAMMGAADAVAEIWGLSTVSVAGDAPGIGELVDFLFKAGRRAGCGRMMRV